MTDHLSTRAPSEPDSGGVPVSTATTYETPVSPPISCLINGQQNSTLEVGSVEPSSDRYGVSITPVMGTVAPRNPQTAPSAVTGLIVAPSTNSVARRWDGTRDTAINIWLASKKSPHTREAYRRNIGRWFDWCDLYGIDPADARRGDIDAYRIEMQDDTPPPSDATIAQRLATISSFYKYWLIEEQLPRNPAEHASRPSLGRTPGSIALTLTQARQFVDYADSRPDLRAALVVRLLLETGMRVSELCEAEVASLGMSSGHRTLTIVRKGGVEAVTVLTIRTAHTVDDYLAGRRAGPLLVTSNGTALDRAYVRRLVRRLAKEAGLPSEVVERMHPHVLRHTAATLLDEANVPMQRIQRQLGHADIRQTELYAGHRQDLEASPVYVLGSLLAA